MRLFEFSGPKQDSDILVALINQLQSNIDTGKVKPNWTVDEFLNLLQSNDISLGKQDFYDMIKVPPLNTLISNTQGDDIVFKGQDQGVNASPDQNQNEKVVKQMAQSAMN